MIFTNVPKDETRIRFDIFELKGKTWDEYKKTIIPAKSEEPDPTISFVKDTQKDITYNGMQGYVIETVYTKKHSYGELLTGDFIAYVFLDVGLSDNFILKINNVGSFMNMEDYEEVIDKMNNFLAGSVSLTEPVVYAAYPRFFDNNDSDNVVENEDALSKFGEDEGSFIPALIVLGIGAIAGGFAYTQIRKKNKLKEQNDGSLFKMYTKKDFGNSLKIKTSKPIYAKITEIKDGKEIDRIDLSRNIQIDSKDSYTRVSNTFIIGNYVGANIYVNDTTSKNTTISFKYIGQGGTFTKNIKFKIISGGYIEFPDQGTSMTMIKNLLFNDKEKSEVRFNIKDFVSDADIVEILCRNSEIECKYERIKEFEYKVIINNNTSKQDKKISVPVSIKVSNKEENAETYFNIDLYPEGISVDGYYEKENLIIDTTSSNTGNILDYSIKPTIMKISLALKDKKEVKLISDNFKFSKLKGKNKSTENMIPKFEYNINTNRSSEEIYYFEPKVTLAVEDEYLAVLNIKNSYNEKEYSLDLPVKILADTTDYVDPKSREYEYNLLKRAINRYGLQTNGKAQELLRACEKKTPNELKMIRIEVIKEAIAYYSKESKEFLSIEESLAKNQKFFELVKWLNDQAFSYIVASKMPNSEYFITPLKDLFLDLIGERSVAIFWNRPLDFGATNVFMQAEATVENGLIGILTGEDKKSPKKFASLVATFAFVNFIKHYQFEDETKGDFTKSILKTYNDCSISGFKTLCGAIVMKKLGKDSKITNAVGKYITRVIPKGALSSEDLVKKFAEETFGIVMTSVFESIGKDSTGITIKIGDADYKIINKVNPDRLVNKFSTEECDVNNVALKEELPIPKLVVTEDK